jgi:hypothetical protein|nr:MAG TPA: hypothetical protein [Caudoviricetes sp.]
MAAPFTRSGRQRWGGGLSPGVAGVCFSVCGYFAVVIFGVSAGRACCVLFCVVVFACLCVGVLVACVRVCVLVCVLCWLCVYVCSMV